MTDLCDAWPPLTPGVRWLAKSPTLAIHERSLARLRSGRPLVALGLATSPFPAPAPLVTALRESADRNEYLPARGSHELRDAVASHHRRRHGTSCTAEDVLIGPGSKALMFLLQLAFDGELIVPTPAWLCHASQARILGRSVRLLHARGVDDFKLDPSHLDAHCAAAPGRRRVLVLNSPSNPTGRAYERHELEKLAEVAARHGVIVVSDEIYAELRYDGGHVSIAPLYPDGTIVSSGLSKWCGADGWRLGTFAFPQTLRWLREAMEAVASETYTATSTPIQVAAITAFEGGIEIERHLWRVRRILGSLARELLVRLRAAGACALDPVAGFCLFADFGPLADRLYERNVTTSRELSRRLFDDAGVAVLPGTDFGRPAGELVARLAFVDFDGARALAEAEAEGETLRVDRPFLERHCGRMLDAVDRVRGWLV